jgi:dienelactone hydrolase
MRWHWKRLGVLLLALCLIGSSWLGIAAARSGLKVRSLSSGGVPLLYLTPKWAKAAPGVLVAHGFAGSKQLMLGYGHTLAHAGYAAMLWDFDGHGANGNPLRRDALQQNLNLALQALLEQPEVDPNRLALLGHSMGSGIVMTAGIQALDRFAATIAVSPTGANVTPKAPQNLQLQVGSGEGRLTENAKRLLKQAGGENPNLGAGRGRSLAVIPGVEHITILFSDRSHQAALSWLNTTFERTSNSPYADRRMGWYSLHLLGWLLGLAAFAFKGPRAIIPLSRQLTTTAIRPLPPRRWLGLVVAPLAAAAGLIMLSQRFNLQDLGGIQVGGAVGVWFLIAGSVWLGVMARLPRPILRDAGLGLALFAFLWIAFGAMAQTVWLQWWLIPMRVRLWLPLAITCLPWFLAAGVVQQDIKLSKRILWWLAQSTILVGGFALTISFLPQLSFIFLLLPLFPLLMGILALAAGLLNQIWVYAIGAALFFGWLLAAGFPLST